MKNLNLQKLKELNNQHITKLVQEAVQLCKPAKVTVITDSKEDIAYLRDAALNNGEEKKLKMEGHTIHFDGYHEETKPIPDICCQKM